MSLLAMAKVTTNGFLDLPQDSIEFNAFRISHLLQEVAISFQRGDVRTR